MDLREFVRREQAKKDASVPAQKTKGDGGWVSLYRICEDTGIAYSTLNNHVHGRSRLSVDTVNKIIEQYPEIDALETLNAAKETAA